MKNISIISSMPDKVQVLIEGSLIIRDSAEIKEVFLNLLESYQSIQIQFKDIDKLDVSALQLLAALNNSASALKKVVSYHFEDSDYLNDILNTSGYNKFFTSHL